MPQSRLVILYFMGTALVIGPDQVLAQRKNAWSVGGNLALVTDYRFRGVSQTNEKGAIQGGLELGHEGGFYAGIWASNVNFGAASEASTEMDYYAGYRLPLRGDLELDIGLVYFDYEGDAEADYIEYAARLAINDLSLAFIYADEYLGAGLASAYVLAADYSHALGQHWRLNLHAGYTRSADDQFAGPGDNNYFDYGLGISRELAGLSLSLTWVGTDLDHCQGCDDTLVFALGKEF